MAPSCLILLDLSKENIVLIDIAEEEPQSKTEKNAEDSNIVQQQPYGIKTIYSESNQALLSFYKENFSSYTLKIDLPPPELIV